MFRTFHIFILFFVTMNCYAFHCTVNTTGQRIDKKGGEIDVPVEVSAQVIEGRSLVFDMKNITCATDSAGVKDDLYLTSISSAVSSAAEVQTADVAAYNGSSTTVGIPYSGGNIDVLHLDKKTTSAKINMQIYLGIIDSPSNPLPITEGQLLYKITFRQDSSASSSYSYTWNLIASNSIHFITSSCTINDGAILNVDFGIVNASEIKNTREATKTVSKTFPIHCDDGISNSMGIEVIGTNTVEYDEQSSFVTSDPNLGVVISNMDVPLSNRDHYVASMVNGEGSTTLDFSLVKQSADAELLGGTFSSSAVLVVVEP